MSKIDFKKIAARVSGAYEEFEKEAALKNVEMKGKEETSIRPSGENQSEKTEKFLGGDGLDIKGEASKTEGVVNSLPEDKDEVGELKPNGTVGSGVVEVHQPGPNTTKKASYKENLEDIVKLAEAGVPEAKNFVVKLEGMFPGLGDALLNN